MTTNTTGAFSAREHVFAQADPLLHARAARNVSCDMGKTRENKGKSFRVGKIDMPWGKSFSHGENARRLT